MITATIQIGNTDNKLSQSQWAHFVADMKNAIEAHVYRIHFCGGSDWDAPWQNACWVCEVHDEVIDALTKAIKASRKRYKQDSASVTWGDSTEV